MNKMFLQKIDQGESLVMDNTNYNKDKRKFYIESAQEKGYTIMTIQNTVDKDFALRMNYFRKYSFFSEKQFSVNVSSIAIYSLSKVFLVKIRKWSFHQQKKE